MGMIPMIAPDGTAGDIPKERVADAVNAGFKMAVQMTAPDGSEGWVPRERFFEAMDKGFKHVPEATQPEEEKAALGREAALGFGGAFLPETENPIRDAALAAKPDFKNPLTYIDPSGVGRAAYGAARSVVKGTREVAPVVGKAMFQPNAPITKEEAETAAHGGGTLLGVGLQAAQLRGKPTANPIGRAVEATGERIYQGALKPSLARNTPSQIKSMVKAGIEEGIPVSESGAKKLEAAIDDLNKQVTSEISSKPGATISKASVESRLRDTEKKFSQQVTPQPDLETIGKASKEFQAAHPTDIPVGEAQRIKVGTYRQLKGKYGELSAARIESEKTLARGIKEELETQFPGIKEKNAHEGRLIGLDEAIEKAVNRGANRDFFGLGGRIAAGVGASVVGAITRSPAAAVESGVAATVLHHVLTDPAVQSRLGIAIGRAGRKMGMNSNPAVTRAAILAYMQSLDKEKEKE